MHKCCSPGVPMTDTKILACCKSPETSTRVTVTPFMRGSRNSKIIVSLATSRTTSATRARRCVFMELLEHLGERSRIVGFHGGLSPPARLIHFNRVIQHFGHWVRLQSRQHLAQDLSHMTALVADRAESYPHHLA